MSGGVSGFFSRIRSRFAFVVALAMMPAGAVAIIQAVSNVDAAENARHEALANEVRLRARGERDLLVEVRETLKSVGREALEALNAKGTCDAAVSGVPDRKSWMSRIVVVDNNGMAMCGASAGFSIANLPIWRDDFMVRPRYTLGSVRSSRLSGAQIILAFWPLSSSESDVASIATGIRISAIRDLSDAAGGQSRPFALIGNDGETIVNQSVESNDWLPVDIEETLGPGTSLVKAAGRDGVARNYITYPLVPGEVWAVTGAVRTQLKDVIFSRQGLPIIMPIVLWLIAVCVAFVAIDRMVTRHVKHLRSAARKIGAGQFDTPVRSLDGAPLEIEMLGASIAEMANDLARRETRLQELLSNQKSLLLEVHHRVKNNLQMISSLMNIQSRRVANDVDKDLLQLVQDRIHGLALVHQNLYATERLDHVALDQLVTDVSRHLSKSLRPLHSEIDMAMELEPVTVDAAIGTPVALFVTEAMSNVFKHATAPHCRTEITVVLKESDDAFSLTITNRKLLADGSPKQRGPTGLGSRLMQGFARQLNGTLDWIDSAEVFGVVLEAPVSTSSMEFEIRRDKSGAQVAS